MRNLFQKPFFKKILSPFVRGLVKSLPMGTPIVELITNLTTPSGNPKKHSVVSQLVQWVMVGLIVYDVIVNKGTTLKQGLDLIMQFASTPETTIPAETILKDTIR